MLLMVLLDSVLVYLFGSKEEGVWLVVEDCHLCGRHHELIDELVDRMAAVNFDIKWEAGSLTD